MKKNNITKALIILLICVIPQFTYAHEFNSKELNVSYNHSTPPSLKDMKAKEQFIDVFNEIKRIRANLYVQKINSLTAKEKYASFQRDINYYIGELNKIIRDLDDIKRQYPNSKSDQIFAKQLQFVVESIKLSLDEIIILLDAIKNDDFEGNDLFYSDYLAHIYFYLTLADQMIAYVDNYYSLNK
ncbi:hypothetical protein [Paraclostridium dentum]|uniref:hypothetical protein n=1 Tax=Paraclostridium dentum TaxID=2662455 RepID=UPI003F30D38D